MGNATEVGLQLWIYVTGGILLAAAALLALSVIMFKRASYWDEDIWIGPIIIAGLATLVTGLVLAIGLIPYQAPYWKLYRVSGHVESVSNVLTDSSGELTSDPVVTLDSVDRDIVMTDPRATKLEGKDVELTCYMSWRYKAADRYSCEIYKIKH